MEGMEPPAPARILTRLPIGTRVVVRYLIEGGERATDALGYLRSVDETGCVVQTRRGDAHIDFADVVAAKPVPPPPQRRTRPVEAPPGGAPEAPSGLR